MSPSGCLASQLPQIPLMRWCYDCRSCDPFLIVLLQIPPPSARLNATILCFVAPSNYYSLATQARS